MPRPRSIVAALVLAVAAPACGSSEPEPTVAAGGGDTQPVATVPAAVADPRPPVTVPAPTTVPPPRFEIDASQPDRIRIPKIKVNADVIDLGLLPDGTLETPDADYSQAGWWTGGPAPGEQGPTVIVGHIDDYRGPAVFFRLRELQVGDEVEVVRDDGSSVFYVVDGAEQVDKDAFPTERVYGMTDAPELRLVTCGGRFDRQKRSYDDNYIVYATLRT